MKLAIFDFDGTLFPHDTIPYLLTQWKKLGLCSKKHRSVFRSLVFMYIKFKLGIETKLTREEMKLWAVRQFNTIFKGMTETEVLDFFKKASNSTHNRFNKKVVCALEEAQKMGYHTVLLSGSYEPFLAGIAHTLKFDTVMGTPIHTQDGMYDETHPLSIASGIEKVERIKHQFPNINWSQSIAYADSLSDLFILENVGTPFVVNPDRGLKRIALLRNWQTV